MQYNRPLWPGWHTDHIIGEGRFGTVYAISRQVFGDTEWAALKVVSIPQHPSHLDELYSEGYDEEGVYKILQSSMEQIISEYSMMRRLNGNTNIVHCDDVCCIEHEDGIGWDILIKMELLTPMPKFLGKPIPEQAVIKAARDLCRALELCRQHGILHRDIKPQNIFVSPNGDFKLGDFSIAKMVERTMGGTKIGWYQYMAPEIYNNQPYGTRTDIYALGLVLYWMLNERRMPFMPLPPNRIMATTDLEARRRRLSGEPLPPPKNGSRELQRIVLKACSYDPEDRYPSAGAMLEDLKRLPLTPEIDPQMAKDRPSDRPTAGKTSQPRGKPKKKRTVSLITLGAIGLLALVLSLAFCGRQNDPPLLPYEMETLDLREFNGRYYYILDTPQESYEEAADLCRTLGGHMADVNSAEENRFLYEYLSSEGYDHVFLGGSDSQEDGVWKWESGEPFDYVNWAEGEPNNDLGGEEHLAMYHVLSDGSWNDIAYSTPSFREGTARIGDVQASSYCTDDDGCTSSNLIDGDPATAWCTAASDPGIGETVLFTFTKKERLTGITVHSVDPADGTCRRPANIRLIFDDGTYLVYALKDEPGEQYIPFIDVTITDSVKLVIDSAHGPEDRGGIGLSEVTFHTEDRKTGFVCEWSDEKTAKEMAKLMTQP